MRLSSDEVSRAVALLEAAGLDPAAVVRALASGVLGFAVCRQCGCTDWSPCDEGCWWVAEDLCSACAGEEENGHEYL